MAVMKCLLEVKNKIVKVEEVLEVLYYLSCSLTRVKLGRKVFARTSHFWFNRHMSKIDNDLILLKCNLRFLNVESRAGEIMMEVSLH